MTDTPAAPSSSPARTSRPRLRERRTFNARSLVFLAALALPTMACSPDRVVKWDAQYVRVKAPPAAKISHFSFSLLRPLGRKGGETSGAATADAGAAADTTSGATPPRLQPSGDDKAWELVPPSGLDLAKTGVLVKVATSAADSATSRVGWLRALAHDGEKIVAAGVIRVDTSARGELVLTLRADDPCDVDGDGARDCSQAGCCESDEPSDCDDKAASANPWTVEAGCEACDNQIDEDCDGADLSCVDSDKDGAADCAEAKCGPGASKHADIHPGAPELCDGFDNDCDGETDEGLAYSPIDPSEASAAARPGDPCGLGVCAKGVVTCMADKSGLYCSTHQKKWPSEKCSTSVDDNCNGTINEGCGLDDDDGDGVDNATELAKCAAPLASLRPDVHPNAKEGCCLTYTALVLQLAPDWQPGSAIPAGAKPTQKMLQLCDLNCDTSITPCDPEDGDGDGVPAPLDCDDKNPLRFPGAPERCGDGVLQSCLGADPSCAGKQDADGDGWPDSDDCAPKDKTKHPGAEERCNGLDDDCDGVTDDVALTGATCTGCGAASCVKTCLHVNEAPAAGVCAFSPWQASSKTCAACVPKPAP